MQNKSTKTKWLVAFRKHIHAWFHGEMGWSQLAVLIFVLLALGYASTAFSATEQSLTGPAQVIDGDSLMIDGREIRLHGIDAPEWNQTCETSTGKLAAGQEATSWLRSRIANNIVSCAASKKDRYGRLIATCCYYC